MQSSGGNRGERGGGLSSRLARCFYTHNPFYLLSVCFLLHGTGLWYNATATTHSPWILSGLIATYILMMAGAAVFIVRSGRVWDDARSIFLILLALFLELAMTADDVLILDRWTGRILLVGGWLFAAGVTETVLKSLRIRLSFCWRLPFHVMLALMFLYPLAIVHGDYPHDGERIVLSIFLFSLLAAGSMLTLLPGIRQGAHTVRRNGTPWSWPWFPWAPIGFLIGMLGLRSYALCLSFDPVLDLTWPEALELPNSFGGLHLAPFVLAASVLCVEAAATGRSRKLSMTAVSLPFVALGLTLIPSGDLHAQFVDLLTGNLTSTVQMTAFLAALVLSYAAIRQVRFAAVSLLVAVALLSVIDSETVSLSTLSAPQPLPLELTAVGLIAHAVFRRRMASLMAALLFAFAAFRIEIHSLPAVSRELISLHVLLAVFLASGLLSRGRFAAVARRIAAVLLLVAVSGALFVSASANYDLPAFRDVYMIGMTVVSILFYLPRRQDRATQIPAVVSSVMTGGGGLLRAGTALQRMPGGTGILWILGGITWFAIAAFISLRKGRQVARESRP